MFDLFGSGLPLAARFFIAFLVVLALIGLTAWVVRRFGANRLGGAGARGRQPRLAVIDAASVDGRRRLVLIRRDNIEHLLMIGGPTDVVIEPNIVRAAGARETTRASLPGEPSLRAAPATETAWPLQPANESPTVAPPRSYRAPERGAPPEEAQAPHAPASDEPWLPQEPDARARPAADSLSGLAAELSSKLTPPESVVPPVEPRTKPAAPPPPTEPAPAADHNLSEMAQQLEAALRRAPPPVTDPFATQAHAAAPEPTIEPRANTKPVGRPAPKATPKTTTKPAPRAEQRAEPKFESTFESRFGARAEPTFEPKIEPKPEATFEPKAAPKVEPKVEPKMAPGSASEAKPEPALAGVDKTLYDNLEEEMASLLGRPSGKS